MNQKPAQNKIKPRGYQVCLAEGSLPEVISPYMLLQIQKTGGRNGPLGKQFLAQPQNENRFSQGPQDPLIEEEYEVAPGLVYKYQGKINSNGQVIFPGRVLWLITIHCATYCRFCTRGRQVGSMPKKSTLAKKTFSQNSLLTETQIDRTLQYLKQHREINEIILSGGDPLTTPKTYLTKIAQGLVQLQKQHLRLIRLGTRLPITNPLLIQNWHYQLLKLIKNPYLMVHINHPDELTKESLNVLQNFRRCGATIMSQSVLLAGVNDSVKVLQKLFIKMSEEGIRPYYLFQNDPVYWAQHFTVPITQAIKIWQKLRPRLSGVAATARFVIDTPFGFGKIPLPEGGAWQVNYDSFFDFKGQKHSLKKL